MGIGTSPRSLAINSATDNIYVLNDGVSSSTPRVSVIDDSTNTVVATVGVGNNPQNLAINSATDRIYVPNSGDNTVSVIDGFTNTVVATVGVGNNPQNLAINSATDRIYVPNSGDNTVSVIDGFTNTVAATVGVGSTPLNLAINSATNKIYVANVGDGTVSVIISSVSSATRQSGQDGSCKRDCTPPTLGVDSSGRVLVSQGFQYNQWVADVQRYFTPMDLITVNVGEMNKAVLKIYENSGPDKIEHVELTFGLGKGETVNDKRASIIWEKSWDGIETVTLYDPENALDKDKVNVESTFGSCNGDGDGDNDSNAGVTDDLVKNNLLQKIKHDDNVCLIMTIDHMFREPLEFNMVGTYVWDHNGHSGWQNYFNHGIEIQGDSMNPPKTDTILSDKKGAGTIGLTQIDKWNNIWVDDNGVKYFKNDFGTYIRQTPITMEIKQDPNWTIINRLNNNFDKIIVYEQNRAAEIFDSSEIISQLPESFAYEIPDYQSRWNDDNFVKFIEEQNELAKQYWDSKEIQGNLQDATPTLIS